MSFIVHGLDHWTLDPNVVGSNLILAIEVEPLRMDSLPILFILTHSQVNKAWEPNSAVGLCSQPHKHASAQGHNNKSNNKAFKLWPVAGCEAKVGAE